MSAALLVHDAKFWAVDPITRSLEGFGFGLLMDACLCVRAQRTDSFVVSSCRQVHESGLLPSIAPQE